MPTPPNRGDRQWPRHRTGQCGDPAAAAAGKSSAPPRFFLTALAGTPRPAALSPRTADRIVSVGGDLGKPLRPQGFPVSRGTLRSVWIVGARRRWARSAARVRMGAVPGSSAGANPGRAAGHRSDTPSLSASNDPGSADLADRADLGSIASASLVIAVRPDLHAPSACTCWRLGRCVAAGVELTALITIRR